jgi:phosphonate metabolism-associated iron-containing alcohol dehydrogenase
MNTAPWTHHNPVRIVFRPGVLQHIADYVDAARVALVTTPGFKRRGIVDNISDALGSRLIAVVDNVRPNPDVQDLQTQSAALRPAHPEMLIALGGGSTIDTAKALARLLTQPEGTCLMALLRDGAPVANVAAVPITAIPTTAGTGTEVTPFGTVWNHAEKKKFSIVGEDLFPQLAILDPELTLGMPTEITVASGLDAISHAMESAWNRNATPVSLGLATQSLRLSMQSLAVAAANPADIKARSSMLQASVLAGLAISQSRTALAHSISYPLTATYDLPHGLACSFTLPALLAFNAASDDRRLADLAVTLGYSDTDSLALYLTGLFERLGVGNHLSKYLPDRASIMALSHQMFTPGRAENNLRHASEDEVNKLVNESLDALGLK